MRFDVLTLFPSIFEGFLGESLVHKAQQKGLIEIRRHDFRQWTTDKHHSVDDRPFGGGPGMLIKVAPVVACVEALAEKALAEKALAEESQRASGQESAASCGGEDSEGHTADTALLLLSPQGRTLDQRGVERLAKLNRITLLCGRYEGFDQRVIDILQPEEVSIGDFVLNGGEVAAMVLMEAVIRLLPGVLGDEQSTQQDSFSSDHGRLEGPQYTRPRDFRGWKVPEVLLSGDHEAIAQWREEQSILRTSQRRADLLDDHARDQHARNQQNAGNQQTGNQQKDTSRESTDSQ